MRFVKILSVLLFHLSSEFHKTQAMEDWESWPLEKLEKEVSPSHWNPDKSPDEVIKEYVDTSIAGTFQAQASVAHQLDIPYGTSPSQKFDVYGSDLPPDAPIYVWIHGGYWQEGGKDISGMYATNLHAHGTRNIVIGYTLAPKATLSEIESEIVSALEKIVETFPATKSITVGGHSAGAQLASMLLHTSKEISQKLLEKIQGLHLVSGIFDLRPLVPTYVNNPLKLTRSTAESSSPLRLRKIRDEFVQKKRDFRILVTVGKYDSPLFQQQSQEYYKLLRKTFSLTKFWKSDSDDHFSLVQSMAYTASQAGEQFYQYVEEVAKAENENSHGGGSPSLAPTFGIAFLTGILMLSL